MYHALEFESGLIYDMFVSFVVFIEVFIPFLLQTRQTQLNETEEVELHSTGRGAWGQGKGGGQTGVGGNFRRGEPKIYFRGNMVGTESPDLTALQQ